MGYLPCVTTCRTEKERKKKAVVLLPCFILYTLPILFFSSEETTLHCYSSSSRSGICCQGPSEPQWQPGMWHLFADFCMQDCVIYKSLHKVIKKSIESQTAVMKEDRVFGRVSGIKCLSQRHLWDIRQSELELGWGIVPLTPATD